jgi:hypothetical protein
MPLDLAHWQPLPEPNRRGRRVPSKGVTAAWRKETSTGYFRLVVALGQEASNEVGWARGQQVEARLSPAGDKLAFLVTAGASLRPRRGKTGAISVAKGLPWVQSDRRPAAPVEHEIADHVLIITLPAWARQVPAPATVAPAAAPRPTPAEVPVPPSRSASTQRRDNGQPKRGDAAAPDARDEIEAKQELRKGQSVRWVAEDFGLPISTVQKWQDEVRAETAAGKAA